MQKETHNVALGKPVYYDLKNFAADRKMKLGDAADFLLSSALKVRRVKIAAAAMANIIEKHAARPQKEIAK